MIESTLNFILKRGFAPLAGIALSVLLLSPAFGQALVIEKGKITTDTIWDGEVLIKADVEISSGATLTIMPGTVVKFTKIKPFGPGKLYEEKTHQFPRAELIIRGKIIAKGTKEKMITFTSAFAEPGPADWGAVNLLDSKDNIFDYCDFSYAHTAIHAHSGKATITNSYLHDNGVAIGMKNVNVFKIKSEMNVRNNLISTNGGGLLFGKGAVMIATNNDIINSELFGIYCKKGGASSVIKYNNISNNQKGVLFFATENFKINHNNISGNKDYNMSLLTGQVADLDARSNWWGTTDETKIKELNRDKDEEADLGTIIFSDYAKEPIADACMVK